MFGSHKRQGREAGVATRNTFASVSAGTSLFTFGKGFEPTLSFLAESYVLAFSNTTINLMMKYVFKGESWATGKMIEFQQAAVAEFSLDPRFVEAWLDLMESAKTDDDFALGKDHASGVFFAMSGLISPTSADPLAVKAREAARNLPPPADFAQGMLWVTVREFLHRNYPVR